MELPSLFLMPTPMPTVRTQTRVLYSGVMVVSRPIGLAAA